jgi:3-hydroxy-9,10-secoandrosta-1,3,5(10)-triene-9,17-dione monooxygenase
MTTIEAPAGADLIRRATYLIPLIKEHAAWQEEHRIMHDETPSMR